MKLKNILVPVDFSNCSNNALLFAIQLVQQSESKLWLLNCYTVQIPSADITIDLQPTLAKEYHRNAENSFVLLRDKMPSLGNVAHEELIKISFIRDGILQTAKEVEADLIVMGTKGADNRLDTFFGSNTYGTIKKSKTPVLVIPEIAKFQPIKKVLFAADFKHIEDVHGLDIIKAILSLFGAKVEILHVGHGWSELSMHQSREAAAIVEYFNHEEHDYHFIKDEVDVYDAIENHLKTHENELLVLIARKHQFPGSLFKKKVTRRSALHTDLPLLTIPDLR